jgi:hypothetical protein
MTTQTQQFRRRSNGTIDIDHYRERALMERRAAMSSMGRRLDVSLLRLITAAALIVALIALPSRGPVPKGAAAIAAPATITAALQTR